MTWLFTQVWLWSLAAFVLGSLINWLLFVRPLRRRLNALLRSEYERQDYSYPEEPAAPPERDSTALDLLDMDDHRAEPVIGAWDRPPRAWSSRLPERPEVRVPAREDSREWEIPDWGKVPDASPRQFEPREDPAEVTSVVPPVDDSQLRLEEEQDRADRAAEPPGDPTRTDIMRVPQPPTAPPEVAADDPGASNSTWFQKADVEGEITEGDLTPAAEKPDADASTPLRSLFEPLGTNGQGDASAEAPAAPIDETQAIPRIEEPAPDSDQNPLPRRTPGAGPRPGAQNLNGATPEPPPEAGQEGYRIKGHFASRQYHTPESPQYERVVAEVWFRTPSEAEQAGFEPWDGRGPA